MFTAADGVSGLDFYDYAQQTPDVSEGRLADGESRWYSLITPTPGAPNSGASAIEDQVPGNVPTLYGIRNAPNPFNPKTEILFTLGQADDVTVSVYDLNGRLMRTLHRGPLSSGEHKLNWDGNDEQGRRLASGAYFARIVTETTMATQKMLLLK